MNKNITLVKRAIATVTNFEKDRLKDHWRVNVIVIKKLKENNKRINYQK